MSVESDEMHAFKTLRHFPELSHSLRSLQEQKETKGRGFKPKLATIERTIQMKSTHGLERLTGSALGEVNALNNFRKTLLADRVIIKETLLAASTTGGNVGKIIPTQKVLSPLASAQEKLRIASVSFQGGGSTLNEFRSFKTLPKADFIDQLKRSINIQLMRDEQDALCEYLNSQSKAPKSNSDSVECVLFIRYFLRLGEEGKAEIRNREKALEEVHRQQRIREEQEFVEKNMGDGGSSRGGSAPGVGSVTSSNCGGGPLIVEDLEPTPGAAAGPDGSFSPAGNHPGYTIEEDSEFHSVEVSTVLEKLSVTAVNWDNSSFIESVCTSGFEAYLTAAEFRVQIAKSFGIKLSEAEVSSLMAKYMVRKEAPPSQPNKPSTNLVDDGSFSIARSYNKPSPSTMRRQKNSSGKNSGSNRRNFSPMGAGGGMFGGMNSGGMSTHKRGPPSVFTNAVGLHVSMYGGSAIEEYCIDGHMFLKDFLSGTSIRKPAEAMQKQQKAVYQRRRDKVNQMGQNVDCLPKVLGR